MTKTEHVLFEFADPSLKAVDHFDDLSSAIEYASVNLRARHNIKLHKPVRVNDFVVSAMDMPDDLDNVSFGVHLKGVARYLLNNADFPYKNYRIGTRLLYYMRCDKIFMNTLNNKHILSENDIKIPPELGVAKALSINPEDIEERNVESIGVCYRCKKPIKDWSDGGIHNFSMRVDSYSYPYYTTVLLCSECGWRIQKSIIKFLYE